MANLTAVARFKPTQLIFVRAFAKKKKVAVKQKPTEEALAVKSRFPNVKLEEFGALPQPVSSLAYDMTDQIERIAQGSINTDLFEGRNRHRFMAAVGKESKKDTVKTNEEGSCFVSGLTELQHNAQLPPSLGQARFSFPHTLHYKTVWAPAQTTKESDYSMCFVSLNMDELRLPPWQEAKLIKLIGEANYDSHNRVGVVKSDTFSTLCQNAAFLGDALQMVMKEVTKSTSKTN